MPNSKKTRVLTGSSATKLADTEITDVTNGHRDNTRTRVEEDTDHHGEQNWEGTPNKLLSGPMKYTIYNSEQGVPDRVRCAT